MNPICPNCKGFVQTELNETTLRYTCAGCKTTWSRNYLTGWNDAYAELCEGAHEALENLEINYDIDGNSMGESDAARKLRRLFLVNVPGELPRKAGTPDEQSK